MPEMLVTYPAGSTAESSTVAAVTRVDGQVLFAVSRTPCHPESPRWPDQPEDRATLYANGTQTSVQVREGWLLGTELGSGDPPEEGHPRGTELDPSAPPRLDPSAPPQEAPLARPEQAIPCVLHSVPVQAAPAVGEEVTLRVDESYREALSRSHSRCHVVSLALNAALKEAWRKDPPARDSLGSPDFDKLAIVSSRIDEQGSLDTYRIGRNLRKSGFSVEALSDPDGLAEAVRDLARGWLLSSPAIAVTPGECPLQERRTWRCELPAGTASFPCGGTHPSRLEPDENLEVAISWSPGERRLRMRAQSRTFHL
jgi:alanyl-tRNA synthetase